MNDLKSVTLFSHNHYLTSNDLTFNFLKLKARRQVENFLLGRGGVWGIAFVRTFLRTRKYHPAPALFWPVEDERTILLKPNFNWIFCLIYYFASEGSLRRGGYPFLRSKNGGTPAWPRARKTTHSFKWVRSSPPLRKGSFPLGGNERVGVGLKGG